jgi:hypothetical protein
VTNALTSRKKREGRSREITLSDREHKDSIAVEKPFAISNTTDQKHYLGRESLTTTNKEKRGEVAKPPPTISVDGCSLAL